MFSSISYLLIILHFNLFAMAEPFPWDGFLGQMQQMDVPYKASGVNSAPALKNNVYKAKNKRPLALIFTPGMGEPALKYYELATDFASLPATLYFWDHMGQGFSTHLLPEDLGKTHIDSFETHVGALKEFLKSVRAQHEKVYFVGHSMGGHIGLRVMQESPELIDKIVVSSPMVDIRRYYLPISWIRMILFFLTPTDYMWGASVKKTGHTVLLTHSDQRRKIYQDMLSAYPQIARRWVTVQWTTESLLSIEKLRSEKINPIEKPILMLTAEHEVLVSPTAQKAFCAQQKSCKLHSIKNAYHELFVEEDPQRKEAIDLTLEFLKN